jgi:hypothetical protein
MAERAERRLTRILSADVAGYRRLMRADEDATLALLTRCRDIAAERIAEHRGRIANTAGDAVPAEFLSVSDGVACAPAIQEAVGEEHAALPSDRRMLFRIGVHLGDVMVREGDLFGDAVNIAARLQALAEPSSDQAPERFEIADQNRCLAETYQALAMPVLKNSVDAFPTASGHVAELSLGDVKLHRCARQPVQSDALGKAERSIRSPIKARVPVPLHPYPRVYEHQCSSCAAPQHARPVHRARCVTFRVEPAGGIVVPPRVPDRLPADASSLARRASSLEALRLNPPTFVSSGTEGLQTPRWRRQSRANPEQNSLGKIQGISSIWSSAAVNEGQKGHQLSALRANSLRIRTGNFLRPCRELNRAIREIFSLIRESALVHFFGHLL